MQYLCNELLTATATYFAESFFLVLNCITINALNQYEEKFR